MKQGSLSDQFLGVGTKILKATEVDPTVSHGHELQGVDTFRAFLGTPSDKTSLPVTYVWLADDVDPISLHLTGTWYDGRRKQPHREPEYRLYYPKAAEAVVHLARAGDRLFLCQPKSGPLLALFCPQQSSIELQLLWLFGLELSVGEDLELVDLRRRAGRSLGFAARSVLDLIGVEAVDSEDEILERLLKTFGENFPTTERFSAFARAEAGGLNPRENPDAALVEWMDVEERLFRTLERHIVAKRISQGFMIDGEPDVDGFVVYSIGVHNRRKARAGWAFSNHIAALLSVHQIKFAREATTEKRHGPDFLFPGEAEYHSPSWPENRLTMLAAKTSCKDRWRQVLAEARRIEPKHLLTLEPGISARQLDEMKASALQLVVPSELHDSYQPLQRGALMTVGAFIELVRSRQG